MLKSEVSYHKKRNERDVTSPYDSTTHKVPVKFTKNYLQQFIGFIFSDDPTITRMHLNNLQKLLNIVDATPYEKDVTMYARFWFAKRALDARISMGTINRTSLISAAEDPNEPECKNIIKYLDEYTDKNHEEIQYTIKLIETLLQHAYLFYYRDKLFDSFSDINCGDYLNMEESTNKIKTVIGNLLTDIRKSESKASMSTFSLEQDVMEPFVEETIKNAADDNLALMTGVRALNDMLSPGYLPGRLYMWLGVTGGFKSAMLLYSCYWIKAFNRIQPRRKPTARPTVLYITTENSVEESLIRLFNLSTSTEDIKDFTPEQAIELMRKQGGLTLEEGETNIIMKYYGNLEISTSDLYTIIDEIEEDNNEVIALVFDYIKRIRSSEPTQDEIMRLKYASNEMKDLAIRLKIPVITAQQINRAGNMAIDAAHDAGKEDLGKMLGRGNVAQAWDLLENSDWVGVLNVENERSTGKRYLTIKELKKRYKTMTDQLYINHPFVEGSTIMLVNDVNLDHSVSKFSLASDLADMGNEFGLHGAHTRKPRKQAGEQEEVSEVTRSFSLNDTLGADLVTVDD